MCLHIFQRDNSDEDDVQLTTATPSHDLLFNYTHTSNTSDNVNATWGIKTFPVTSPLQRFVSSYYFAFILVCFTITLVIYVMTCTLLFFKLKFWYGKYNVQFAFQMSAAHGTDDNTSDTSDFDSSIPNWLKIVTFIWRLGTCTCCKCVTLLCEYTSEHIRSFGRARYS